MVGPRLGPAAGLEGLPALGDVGERFFIELPFVVPLEALRLPQALPEVSFGVIEKADAQRLGTVLPPALEGELTPTLLLLPLAGSEQPEPSVEDIERAPASPRSAAFASSRLRVHGGRSHGRSRGAAGP